MTLAFFLKILSDLCFYTCFSAFFAALCGLEGSVLPQLMLAAAAGALAEDGDIVGVATKFLDIVTDPFQ